MRLVTADQIRALEAQAEAAGIPPLTLMEQAGTAAAFLLLPSLTPESGVTIICGKGNNGGDGLVMARVLARAEIRVTIILTSPVDQLSPAAKANAERLTSANLRVLHFNRAADVPDQLEGDFLIDALLGTGGSGEPNELYAKLILAMNASPGKVIALDLPSGVNPDTGACGTVCVQAQETFTFGLPKLGLFVSPAREHTGEISVLPIGLPESAAEPEESVDLFTANDAAALLPERNPTGHKGSFGRILVVGGSRGMAGAPRLSALGSFRSGAGYVTIAPPQSIVPDIASSLMEAVLRPLPDVSSKGVLALRALGEVRALIAAHDAHVLGPGLGRHHETSELIRRVVDTLRTPGVLDADALFAIGNINGRTFEVPHILTPHDGEFSRLFGAEPPVEITPRIARVRDVAVKQKITLLLKGSPTLVASPQGAVTLNPTGNCGMATAGSGDVLAGVIGTFLAQGLPPYDAARLGAYVHGHAGDLIARKSGMRGMMAGDIAASLPPALHQLDTFVPTPVAIIRPA